MEIPTREGEHLRVPAADFVRLREQALRRKVALFGTGRDQPGLYGIGPNRTLLGRAVAELAQAPPGAVRGTLSEADLLESVGGGAFVPAHLTGEIVDPRGPRRRDLALALNGRVAAVGSSFTVLGGERLSMLVPESLLRRGANRVELFAVSATPAGSRLIPLHRARP